MTEKFWKILLAVLGPVVVCMAGCLLGESDADKKSDRDVERQVDKVLDDFKGQ